jgi:hypothetical protein
MEEAEKQAILRRATHMPPGMVELILAWLDAKEPKPPQR